MCICFTSLHAIDRNIANVIKDYFKLKNIRNGLILSCYSQRGMYNMILCYII